MKSKEAQNEYDNDAKTPLQVSTLENDLKINQQNQMLALNDIKLNIAEQELVSKQAI